MRSTVRQLIVVCLLYVSLSAQSGSVGIFANAGDVGGPAIKGATSFDASTGE